MMVWGCLAFSGRLAVVDGTMNSALYQETLKENVQPSVYDVKLKRTEVLQPDLTLIEMLWPDLKEAVHALKKPQKSESKILNLHRDVKESLSAVENT